jgi:hypothetical protein
LQKVHGENFFRENSHKIDKSFNISFSSTFYFLSRFQVLLSDGGSKALQKKFCKTNRVEIFFKKVDKKNAKPIFFLFFSCFFLSRFWAFLGEAGLKTQLKKSRMFFYRPRYFFGHRGTNQPRRAPGTAPCRTSNSQCQVPLYRVRVSGYFLAMAMGVQSSKAQLPPGFLGDFFPSSVMFGVSRFSAAGV